MCRDKNKLVFTWMGSKAKHSTPLFGTTLKDKCGKPRMPPSMIIKAESQEVRDEWYKRLYAAILWARANQGVREEWIEMSNEYARASADGAAGGFVLPSTFVKKTEDQLDAFREWVLLIFDYPRKMFGWSGRSKHALDEFKADVVSQLCAGLNLPEARVRVLAVHKADSKKTWKPYRSRERERERARAGEGGERDWEGEKERERVIFYLDYRLPTLHLENEFNKR